MTTHRDLPHSDRAELNLLGACFIDGNDSVAKCIDGKLTPDAFFAPANRIIFETILSLYNSGAAIELAVVAEELKASRKLNEVGGYAYLTQVSDRIPTTAQLSYFIGKLVQLKKSRDLIRSASLAVENIYAAADPELVSAQLRSDIEAQTTTELVRPRSIASFAVPPDNDPSVILGNRYLNRGDGAILSSTSGMGKSSITIQAAVTWSLGQPFFGIKPNGQIRSLIVQAEDSDGDVAEVWHSVSLSLNLLPAELEQASRNVLVVTERVRRGEAFINVLRKWIRDFQPDIVWINPLLAFLDGDVNDAKDTAKFLREGLNGLNEPARFAYIVIHHTTKPPTGKDKKSGRAWNEVMYDMAGSADLTNWARAMLSLRPGLNQGEFELVLAKRGTRAGVVREVEHGLGKRLETVTTIPLKHASGSIPVPGRTRPMPRIFWEYREPDDTPTPAPSKGGRPKTYTFAAIADLIPPEGIRYNELFRKAVASCGLSKGAFSDLVDEANGLGLVEKNEANGMLIKAQK
jgi:hypothetical protein